MQGDIISSDYESDSSPLADRLDASIGETSSGIGAMLSELVRRSLKAGVSDIGDSLGEYASEQVDSAVQEKMPEVAEAANEVAASTARKVISERERFLQSQIEAAADTAIDQSKSHADQIVSHVQESVSNVQSTLDQTRDLAIERTEASERKIDELQDKARATWRKLKSEFATLKEANDQAHLEQKKLRGALAQTQQRLAQQTEEAQQRYEALSQHCEQLSQRLVALEQPRGIKALWAKIGKPRKQKAADKELGGPPVAEE